MAAIITCVLLLTSLLLTDVSGKEYRGKRIGSLSELQHLVTGEVFAVDSKTLHIRGFSYDGTAPDAFFYAGTTPAPSDRGFIIPDENGRKDPLSSYRSKDVTLTLPDGKTLKDIKWISIWCRAFTIDFGNLLIPKNLVYPRPQKIDSFPSLEHDVGSDRIVVVDAQTLLIPNFSYDGSAPDAHFWVGKGNTPGTVGHLVPDENGSEDPLKKYSGKTIVITLPADLTVFDIDFISIWCRSFLANFGHVNIPKNLNVPPSLKMLGVAPQTKLNCEVLWDDLAFEIRWAVAGESIVMQLVGRVSDGEYMAFGLSGSTDSSVMLGGDVVVAWLDQVSGRGAAIDYALTSKSQCQGGRGACPDSKAVSGSNNVRLLNAALINDFTMLTFQRPLRAHDLQSDKAVLTNMTQAVIWAVGPVNSQGDTSYHRLRQRGDFFVEFGRTPRWNCPLPEDNTNKKKKKNQGSSRAGSNQSGINKPAAAVAVANPWYIPPIPCYEPEDGVFYAQIGPTAGASGYNAITGHVGWGISWYINGLLIPEINVIRGKTYTFVVEGGSDPSHAARYHPFYITDDPEGGYKFKTPAERGKVRVFAGVAVNRDGEHVPSGVGRLCEWTEDPNQPANAFGSFGAYQRSLQLDCQEGQPGIVQWIPDANTPDTVFYQCFTHRFLGWKIIVHDACDVDQSTVGTENVNDYDYDDYYYYDDNNDVTVDGSVRHETRLKPYKNSDRRHSNSYDFSDFETFSQKFPTSGFDNFPFQLSKEDFSSISSSIHPKHRTSIPLGAPGFKFPKLPNLKRLSSVVNASAFAQLGVRPRDVPAEFFSNNFGEFESPKLKIKEDTVKTKETGGKIPFNTTERIKILRKKTTVASRVTTAVPFTAPTKRTRLHYTDKNKILLSTTHRPISRKKSSPSIFRRPIQKAEPTIPTTKYYTHKQDLSTHKMTNFPSTHKYFSTTEIQNKTPVTIPSISRYTPPHINKHSQTTTPAEKSTVKQNSKTHKRPEFVSILPGETQVITASALPLLPGQLNSISTVPHGRFKTTTSPEKETQTPRHTLVSQKHQNYGPTFAQNTGFNPQSVIYESDFQPVQQNSPGNQVLAFEVSSTDVRPIHAPLSPQQLQHHTVRPRASHQTTKDYQRRIDNNHKPRNRVVVHNPNNQIAPVDLYQSTTQRPRTRYPIKHKNYITKKPIKLNSNPFETISNMFFDTVNRNKFSLGNLLKSIYPSTHKPRYGINRIGDVTEVINNDMLDLNNKNVRRITSHVDLSDDHIVPVPQIFDASILNPIVYVPPENDDPIFSVAASETIYTSDGRPLSPNAPRLPPLPILHRRPIDYITNRPQSAPYRGPLPPPIPSNVQHLPQFSRQRPPKRQRITTIPPPPHLSNMNGPFRVPLGRYIHAGSSQIPVGILHNQEEQGIPSSLLLQSVVSVNQPSNTITLRDKNNNDDEVITAIPFAPTIEQKHSGNNKTQNKTQLTILKDVWTTLTQSNNRS